MSLPLTCRPASRGCGIINSARASWTTELVRVSTSNTVFVGLDVSSKVAGVAVLELMKETHRFNIVEADAWKLPHTSERVDGDVLVDRWKTLQTGFKELNKRLKGKLVHVAIEKKLVSVGPKSGVVGKQTLAEMNGAARLAAFEVFGTSPMQVNSRAARGGFGINHDGSGEEQTRTEVKAKVADWVRATFPLHDWGKSSLNEDQADAIVVALHCAKTELKRAVMNDAGVMGIFRACHDASFPVVKSKSASRLLARDVEIQEELDGRVAKWLEEPWQGLFSGQDV